METSHIYLPGYRNTTQYLSAWLQRYPTIYLPGCRDVMQNLSAWLWRPHKIYLPGCGDIIQLSAWLRRHHTIYLPGCGDIMQHLSAKLYRHRTSQHLSAWLQRCHMMISREYNKLTWRPFWWNDHNLLTSVLVRYGPTGEPRTTYFILFLGNENE